MEESVNDIYLRFTRYQIRSDSKCFTFKRLNVLKLRHLYLCNPILTSITITQ